MDNQILNHKTRAIIIFAVALFVSTLNLFVQNAILAGMWNCDDGCIYYIYPNKSIYGLKCGISSENAISSCLEIKRAINAF